MVKIKVNLQRCGCGCEVRPPKNWSACQPRSGRARCVRAMQIRSQLVKQDTLAKLQKFSVLQKMVWSAQTVENSLFQFILYLVQIFGLSAVCKWLQSLVLLHILILSLHCKVQLPYDGLRTAHLYHTMHSPFIIKTVFYC